MKMYLAVCVLLWAFDGVKCRKYPKGVAELYKKINITAAIVANMTEEIFKNQPLNCKGTIEVPRRSNLPTPSDDCDKVGLHLLREAFHDYTTFDHKSFLQTFWCTNVGAALVKAFNMKNVPFDLLEEAMIDTWFKEYDKKLMPFLRIFVNPTNDQKEVANSWYTFAVRKEGRQGCTYDFNGSKAPFVVGAKCSDEDYHSKFIFTNTPYEDLIIYTLCSWVLHTGTLTYREKCLVHTPGGDKQFIIDSSWRRERTGQYYLHRASPQVGW